jgi:hypothetical protein
MKLACTVLLSLIISFSCSRKKNTSIELLKRDIRTNDYLIKLYENGVENRRRWGDSITGKQYLQIIEDLKVANKRKFDSILMLQKKK